MDAPRYTVIIPVRRYQADEAVLVSLREYSPVDGPAQILVAEGTHPARQRNAAIEKAHGEILVFLDNDCQLGAGFWTELETALAQPEVDIVGGPARLRVHATSREEIFHAMLTHWLIVGPVAARYEPLANFRPTTQAELILCNLAVRRSVFERIGRFSPELYPNEENEWLDRAKSARLGVYYSPALQIHRPQRETWTQFVGMLLRYGIGRTRQFKVSGWRFALQQLMPLILIVPVIALLLGPWAVGVGFNIWLVLASFIAATSGQRLRFSHRVIVGLAAPLIPLTYALGQFLGWFALLRPAIDAPASIIIRNEQGDII